MLEFVEVRDAQRRYLRDSVQHSKFIVSKIIIGLQLVYILCVLSYGLVNVLIGRRSFEDVILVES